MKFRAILLAAAAFAAMLPALPAAAQSLRPAIWEPAQYGVLGVRDIIQAVRAQLGPGDVIGVPILQGAVYIVRWRRADGVVMDVRVDARSGRVIG